MSTGLIALLDDIAALAKSAAVTLDDVAAQAMKAGAKSAGVVIDDAAVTPRYVVGLAAARELPIVLKIAKGSMVNKLLYLLPAALALSVFAPWAITPLLMLGALFLCYEGAEKVYEALFPHKAHEHEAAIGREPEDPVELENRKVAGAIKTDFILSAEIMAITLSAVPDAGFWTQAAVLALVGAGITVAVYGSVALIVKADDAGLALATRKTYTMFGRMLAGFGRFIVFAMPYFLQALAFVGTAAMIWVGGGIVVHGLEEFGVSGLAHIVHDISAAAGRMAPFANDAAAWIASATGAGIVGLVVGIVLIPIVSLGLTPAWNAVKGLRG